MTENNEAIEPVNNVPNEAVSEAVSDAAAGTDDAPNNVTPEADKPEADKPEADTSEADTSGAPVITAQNGQGSGAPSGSHGVPDSIVIAPHDSASIRQSIEALATGQARISSER